MTAAYGITLRSAPATRDCVTAPVSMPRRRTASGDSVTWSTPLTVLTLAFPLEAASLSKLEDLAHPEVPMARSTAAITHLLLRCMTVLLGVEFDLGDRWCRRRRRSSAEPLGLGDAEVQVQRGDEEQVQDQRADQAAEDDGGGRVRDLVAGDVAGDGERRQRQRHENRGHDDRRHALAHAVDDQREAGRLGLGGAQ